MTLFLTHKQLTEVNVPLVKSYLIKSVMTANCMEEIMRVMLNSLVDLSVYSREIIDEFCLLGKHRSAFCLFVSVSLPPPPAPTFFCHND